MRIAVLALLASLACVVLDGQVAACPPGPCLKHRRMPPPVVEVGRYMLSGPSRVPPARFGRQRLQRFLDGSVWIEQAPRYGPVRAIELTSAARIRRDDRVRPTNLRRVLIRELELRNGNVYVAIDAVYYLLARCGNRGRVTSCLSMVGELPAAAQQRFATPP